jgi:GNAT superfamily N-acetyltransferase
LADAPSAFASLYADEAARPSSGWDERAAAGAAGFGRTTYFAFDDGEPVGLAGGYRETPDSDAVELVSMWVAPTARRQDLGGRLVRTVVQWAAQAGAHTVGLWVTEHNEAAVRLYRAAGFVPTGDRDVLRPESPEPVVRMTLPMTPGRS